MKMVHKEIISHGNAQIPVSVVTYISRTCCLIWWAVQLMTGLGAYCKFSHWDKQGLPALKLLPMTIDQVKVLHEVTESL